MIEDKLRSELLTTDVIQIMNALLSVEGEARIVGGAVRDILLDREAGDIDLATNLRPEQVMDVLQHHRIKTIPTGLQHGTLTAVVNHKGYEITSLRRDVTTDGRHADVVYTSDWQEDACRRDFTLNALYVDAHGELFDYFKGHADAKAGKIRFIGDARARIQEDILRILRFFRFYAWFGKGNPDKIGLEACRDLASLIPRLSAERIVREVLKLLSAPDPVSAWRLIIENDILPYFLPEAQDQTRLEFLVKNEIRHGELGVGLVRLAALLPSDAKIASTVAARLKLSKRDTDMLGSLATLVPETENMRTSTQVRRAIYSHGIASVRSALLMASHDISDALAVTQGWESPVFPIKGEDILGMGIEAGPQVGSILRHVEDWWIAGDFRSERDVCLAQARRQTRSNVSNV